MTILLLLSLMNIIHAAPTKLEVEEAKKSIRSLIQPILPGQPKERPKGTEDFRVDQCEKKKIDWMSVLMMKTKAKLEFSFRPGCDVQGVIEPMVFQPFPAKLALRNLKSYEQIESENRITASLEAKPILNLDMTKGVLTGKKGKVLFEADYKVRIDPMNGKKALDENLGGELRISEIYGEKVSIKEKILVK